MDDEIIEFMGKTAERERISSRERRAYPSRRTDRAWRGSATYALHAHLNRCVYPAVSLRRGVCRRFTVSICNPINLALLRHHYRDRDSPRSSRFTVTTAGYNDTWGGGEVTANFERSIARG